MPPKKVAAVVTEYRKWSHADVILRNLLSGYPDGSRPNMQLVSLVTDQVPKNDMSRDLAKKYGFKICDTVADALTLGGKGLAVEGVLSIGEHGQYPTNEKGQLLYPRRRFFESICDVFEKTKSSVPVFNDKHLAATWDDAKWMYDRARKLFVPFLAGSSIPVTWRKPHVVLPKGCELVGAVQIGYGPFEAYGFHALEGLQCMVERRKLASGGREPPEQGVTAVTCHTGKAMWEALDAHAWTKPLLEAGLKRATAHAPGDMRALTAKAADAGTFEIEYRDGFRAFVVLPNGWVHENEGSPFIFAGQRKGADNPDVCQFYLQQPDPFAHFAELTRAIDSLVGTGHAPYPVERTLLTTGVLDAAMTSRHEKGKRIATPHLAIAYTPTDWGPAKGEIPKAVKP
ncbi:hypothetical protein R5W24_004713 [Gemmata sp. JC717]|uniref:hypothetical protein n=1 Tax=Gemmata algarum TaxID=2975278 RepID=UPI0021BB9897|nr:hypothetical protein [Gemmata algarum]MDY3555570.1 hypothetical protein [Gemmata algarum]